MTASCPHCGGALVLHVGAADRRRTPALDWPGDDGVPAARPRKLYRGSGADRESAWGASTTAAVEPGQKLRISSRKGRSWIATVAEIVEPADGADRRSVLALTDATWRSDPEPVDEDAPPDPDWLTDTSQDVGRGAVDVEGDLFRQPAEPVA